MSTGNVSPDRKHKTLILGVLLAAVGCAALGAAWWISPAVAEDTPSDASGTKLVVLWTSGDPFVAERMAFMYTLASKKNKWWDEVTLVVWGPSAKLLSENKDLQDYVKRMQEAGVDVQACIVCANMYGVTDKLRELGITVRGMGKPLTDMLQSGWTLLSV